MATDGSDGAEMVMWLDASCPFTWRTAQWLEAAARRRRAAVSWRPMSLAILNEGKELPEHHREAMRRSVGAMRVLAAARDRVGEEAMQSLYFALGRRRHDDGRDLDRRLFEEALEEVALPHQLADAADDPSWDAQVRASHEQAQAAVGEPSGSPVVGVVGTQAFFGPVLSGVPSTDDGIRLLDALVAAASVPELSELKRARSQGGR